MNGSPTYRPGNPPTARWGSYLAWPIRLAMGDDGKGDYLPVGALCLASMYPQHLSALDPRRRRNLSQLFVYLDSVGDLMAHPNSKFGTRARAR